MWKVVKDVANPNRENVWTIKTESKSITDEEDIANAFNEFFVNKVENLKSGINKFLFSFLFLIHKSVFSLKRNKYSFIHSSAKNNTTGL